jgi:ATP-binding cassette, subfamily B, multidrug efflux pump
MRGSGQGPLVEDEVLGRAYDRRLMGRLWLFVRPYRRVIALSAVSFPLLAAVELVQPYLTKVAIDSHILRGDWPGLSRIALLFLLTLVLQFGLRFAQAFLLAWTGQQVVHDLRQALFTHVQRLSAVFFDKNPVGRLMTRILGDVEAVGELFSSGVVSVLGDVVTLVGVVVAMLVLDWRLALVTFAVVPLLVGVAVYFRGRARAAYREVRIRLARLSAYLQEALVGMSVLQLFTQERAWADEFSRLNEEYRGAVYRRMGFDALLYAGVELVGAVAVAALLWWGGVEIVAGGLTFGVLVAFMEYVQRFFLPIRDASAKYTIMQSATVAAERIFGLLDTEPEIVSPAGGYRPGAAARDGDRAIPALELRDVWFRYPPGSHDGAAGDAEGSRSDRPPAADGWVLRGLSFRVAAGERVAVVGATGAGKTTLARLLTRSYDVTRGAVLVDGVDVREWDLPALRRHVGLVLQDVLLFSGTVSDNLAAGRPDATAATLVAAAGRAHADRFVKELPGGYAAPVRERGANLSQGQRQLLSVARALVYNPAVLVLDEATSSVDPETERLLQDAVDQLLAGRTSVVIAHRFSTIQRADRILVLRGGALAESGTHATLLQRGGLYAALHELQFGSDLALAEAGAGGR